jgi:hypothetical protein
MDIAESRSTYYESLLQFMAEACYYAQSHCGDPDAWHKDAEHRMQLLQCVSFQMACFLCQNTIEGHGGVEWEVVIDQLIDPTLDSNGMMVKDVVEWKKILGDIVDDLGGWK